VSVCVSVREEASFCAVVDGEGELTDFLRLPHIMKRRNGWNRDDADLKVTVSAADIVRLDWFVRTGLIMNVM